MTAYAQRIRRHLDFTQNVQEVEILGDPCTGNGLDLAAGSIAHRLEPSYVGVSYAKVGSGATAWMRLANFDQTEVINKTGSSIAADQLVALSGLDATSGKPKIVLADADVAAHDDVFVTTEAIANNAEGRVTKGALSAATLNTNTASAAGDPVFLGTTAGGFLHTAPVTPNSRQQPVGFVLVKSATVGQILWRVGPVRKIGTGELQEGVTQFVDVTITTAQLLALNATPQTVVAAPAAGKAIIFEGAVLHKPAGTAYAGIGATEDLAFCYTNGSGIDVGVVETTGFLDQATAQTRYCMPQTGALAAGTVSDFVPVAAAALVLALLVGEITTGTSDLIVRVYYRIVPTVLP